VILFGYAALMHEHWLTKRRRSPGMDTVRAHELYTLALRCGVIGGKLVGAEAAAFCSSMHVNRGRAPSDGGAGRGRAVV
jgi:D-glycero-alpha-D-manno-heptose-7-phosphate kinase